MPFDQDEPFDWVELHVRLPDVENNHGGHDREAVVFQLESRPKGGGAWVPTGHGSERCRQGKSGLRLCFFEGFTNLDTSQEYHFACVETLFPLSLRVTFLNLVRLAETCE